MRLTAALGAGRSANLILTLVTLPMFWYSASAQQPEGTKTFKYDVVSVKPFRGDDRHGYVNATSDSFSSNVPISKLIQIAFSLLMPDQVSGAPSWANSEHYSIEAKVDEDTLAALNKLPRQQRLEQRRRMLLAILIERFGLTFHHETREMPSFELVVAKGGTKLKRSDATGSSSSMGGENLKGTGMETSDLCQRLSGLVGRQIIDKTGMAGRFDMELSWSNEDNPTSSDIGPSIFTALQEQLGLKLVSSKAPTDTVVIDALAKPSAN
jgi:uncharacterized protein (TIGR03435 family)